MSTNLNDLIELLNDDTPIQNSEIVSPFQLPTFDRNINDSDTEKLLKNWEFISGKTGGGNKAGAMGGLYQVTCPDGVKRKFYLKQDPLQEKNISEAFSSQFMRFIAKESGEDPDVIANVNYVTVDKEVYIASEVFDGYRDIFLDAYLAYQLPQYENLRTPVGEQWEKLPSKRPGYLQQNACIENMMQVGRYTDIIPSLALRAIVDDPDLHYENIGAIPKERSTNDDIIPIIENGSLTGECLRLIKKHDVEEEKVINGKTYYLFKSEDLHPDFKEAFVKHNKGYYLIPNINNTRAAGIDFGGALGDFRPINPRKFDGQIHTSKLLNFIRYRPSRRGPPSYQDRLPSTLIEGAEFFKTLARFSMIDPAKIQQEIDSEINKATSAYKDKPQVLLRFAKRIGVKIPKYSRSNNDRIGYYLKTFLTENFIARQKHAETLFLEHLCRLNRREQKTLMDSYLNTDAIRAPKEQLMVEFFLKLRKNNPTLFNTFDEIDNNFQFGSGSVEAIKSKVPLLQSHLHQRICNAYFKNNLKNESENIHEIIANTHELIVKFNKTNALLTNSNDAREKKQAVEKFIGSAARYEKKCINTSTNQKFMIAACSLVGGLIGVIVGAAIGLTIGAALGGGAGSVAPVFGNIAGAVAGGSIGGVLAAIKGAGLGAMIGASVAAFLLGTGATYGAGKYTRHLMFSATDKSVSNLSKDLGEHLENKLKESESANAPIN